MAGRHRGIGFVRLRHGGGDRNGDIPQQVKRMISPSEHLGGSPKPMPAPLPAAAGAPDTGNMFLVGAAGDGKIVTLTPIPRSLTVDQALNLAAWLMVIADISTVGHGEKRFWELVNAIKKT
jgi:hypothetical protein